MAEYESLRAVMALPTLMGLGHMVPVMGAVYATTGSYSLPLSLLGMIGGSTILVDSYDTYKDLPLSKRPSKWLWRLWLGFLCGIIIGGTVSSGLDAAISMYRYFAIGLLWGQPCVMLWSKSGFRLYKPKALFREAKSLVAASCLAYVTSGTAMVYCCQAARMGCLTQSMRTRVLALSFVYQFLRETTCDVRDIAEDEREGMKTLPVRLGKTNTMALLAILTLFMDTWLTGAVSISNTGLVMQPASLAGGLVRSVGTVLAYWQILEYPKGHLLSWGCMSLLGLAPLLWAVAML